MYIMYTHNNARYVNTCLEKAREKREKRTFSHCQWVFSQVWFLGLLSPTYGVSAK